MPRTSLRQGEVVLIPIDDRRFGVSQIVAQYGRDAYYFAVYSAVRSPGAADDEVDIQNDLQGQVLLLALSFDAKVANGDWPRIGPGPMPIPDDIPLPAYREEIGVPGNIQVVDYSGKRRRVATSFEAALLPNRVIVSPIRIQKALRAKHGIGVWLNEFDELLPPSSVTTTRDLFSTNS